MTALAASSWKGSCAFAYQVLPERERAQLQAPHLHSTEQMGRNGTRTTSAQRDVVRIEVFGGGMLAPCLRQRLPVQCALQVAGQRPGAGRLSECVDPGIDRGTCILPGQFPRLGE